MTTINTPSIYIHRAHSECDDPDVFCDTFNLVLGADCVRSVDLIKKTDQNQIPFIRAFIHFKFWPHGETADKMYNELVTDKRLEITYNHHTMWFWRFCLSKLPARDNRNTRYGDKNGIVTTVDSGDVISCTIMQRATNNNGYNEITERNVMKKPAWMSVSYNDKAMSDDEEEEEEEYNSFCA
jgi:uncharacterized phage-associated protein